MSKVILTIDLNDEWLDRINTTCTEMIADVTIFKRESLNEQCDYTQRIYRCWSPIKPLPDKKALFYEVPSTTFINGKPVDSYALGFNACIDEILGGNNNG